MIGTIRRHSKWLWLIIIAATIITFVFWGANTSRLGSSGGRSGPENFGSINGERITRDDYFNAQREVYLRYFFSYGDWPDKNATQMGFDVERETYYRLLIIRKQQELGIHVSSEAVARVANAMLMSLNRGNPLPFAVFLKQILQPHGLSTADFDGYVRHDLGIQQMMSAAGLSGQLVTPQELRALYVREHEELSTQAVFLSASNYLASVSVTNDAVARFFTNEMAKYRLPDRVQVAYVRFSVTNFITQAEKDLGTNLTGLVEANALKFGTNYFGGAKTPEESKARIRAELIRGRALAEARKKANEFATILFALEPTKANLEQLARTNRLAVSVSAPFDRSYGPKDLAVGVAFVKAAFALTTNEPFAGPLDGTDGAYVIAMDKAFPSEIPPLDKIHDEVTADYKYSEAVLLAHEAGMNFAKVLTNGLAQGKTFSAVCSELNVRPLLLPPFSMSTRALPEIEDHASLAQFKQAAFGTPLGKSSDFVPTSEGGFIVFVQSRLPLDEARMKADLPAFAAAIRQTRRNEAFNDWFRREAEKGLRDMPLARPAQPIRSTGTPSE
jgi:hypothetical protein